MLYNIHTDFAIFLTKKSYFAMLRQKKRAIFHYNRLQSFNKKIDYTYFRNSYIRNISSPRGEMEFT